MDHCHGCHVGLSIFYTVHTAYSKESLALLGSFFYLSEAKRAWLNIFFRYRPRFIIEKMVQVWAISTSVNHGRHSIFIFILFYFAFSLVGCLELGAKQFVSTGITAGVLMMLLMSSANMVSCVSYALAGYLDM